MISMFSIGSAVDTARYHDKAFKQDGNLEKSDNYYLNEKAPAVWQGKGANFLGIQGDAVKREDFLAFLEGKLRNPASGEIQHLAANAKGKDRRAGMDFTVSPPKSVSIVGLVGGDERVTAAHLAANASAMAWLEKHASIIRVKDDHGSTRAVPAGNLLYATVHHVTNRENEPQMHNHNIIVSAVYDKTAGKWRSLTNDQMLTLRAQADVVYKAELAHGLKAAGYALTYDKNGIDFEIAGLSQAQLDTYSSRRAQIKETLKARGIDLNDASFGARQTAALDSRASKHELPRDALQVVWQETAQSTGLDLPGIVRQSQENTATSEAIHRPVSTADDRQIEPIGMNSDAQKAALRAVSWAAEHLSEREQSFTLAELETTALTFSRGRLQDVESAIATHVKNQLLVERGLERDGSMMLTTQQGRNNEFILEQHIAASIGKGNVVLVDPAEFNAAVNTFEARKSRETGSAFKLSNEQINAARNVLMHVDGYQGIQGEAGTGKTAALALVQEVAASRGWQVMGVATSAAAAKELGTASGIASQTVASLFADRENAIRLAETQLGELQQAMAAGSKLPGSPVLRVESHQLHVTDKEHDFGKARYAFDHQRGDVFKNANNLTNVVGTFFMDRVNGQRDQALDRLAQAETFGERLQAQMLMTGVVAAETLGRHLVRYEQVGTVEAIAARNTLYQMEDSSRNRLLRAIDTKSAELDNLKRTGNKEGKKTLLIMDESSMTGAEDTAKLSTFAREIGARVVFQGDTKQHGSVPAGRAFKHAQQSGMHLSVLQETRRFDNATTATRQAIQEMRRGDFGKAIGLLDRTVVEEDQLADVVAARYLANLNELKAGGIKSPRVGVVVMTNTDRKHINNAIRSLLADNDMLSRDSFVKSHMDDPKLTQAEQRHAGMIQKAGVNRLIFRKQYAEIGVKKDDVVKVIGVDVEKNRIFALTAQGKQLEINPQRQDYFSPAIEEERVFAKGDRVEARANIRQANIAAPSIDNGTRGVITKIDKLGATIKWDDGVVSRLGNHQLRVVDHAYAHTSFKEQGATNDREIIAVSKTGAMVFNREAAYVAASRARDNTEIVTSDLDTLQKNAGKEVPKTTAIDWQKRMDQSLAVGPSRELLRETPALESVRVKQAPKQEQVRDGGHELERS